MIMNAANCINVQVVGKYLLENKYLSLHGKGKDHKIKFFEIETPIFQENKTITKLFRRSKVCHFSQFLTNSKIIQVIEKSHSEGVILD
jgi:hypothetical protein